MSTKWDPDQYLRFADERSRPFTDLLARIPVDDPRTVVDLGCGPGTTTVTLLDRWPHAQIEGVDSSQEMIRQAQEHTDGARLRFRHGDLREWQGDGPVDVLLTCATLQWVPGHLELFPRFVGALADGGCFAFQVPGNFDQPSHVLLHELATSARWSERLSAAVEASPRSHEPDEYLGALLSVGAVADVWETTYLHVLHGPDAVLQWIKGTGLRPVLSAFDQAETNGETRADTTSEKEEFLSAYAAVLRAAYPMDDQGRTVFPFRRIFGVGRV
jgi:trans-aconitate 2-methyltransferase